MSRRSGVTSTQAPAPSDAKLGMAFVMSLLKENPFEPSDLRYMVEGSLESEIANASRVEACGVRSDAVDA
jgi:hypothetical protein